MKRGRYFISRLQCSECNHIMTVPRYHNNKRKRHHIKTMYCPYCQIETDFIELEDFEDWVKND